MAWEDEGRPHLSGSQRMELLKAKFERSIRDSSESVSSNLVLGCHPEIREDSHTGPSMIGFFRFVDKEAFGHAPNTLHLQNITTTAT